MQYRPDRQSDNKLSTLGLGCMRFFRDKSESERVILTAIERGVNYFDTAYIYPGSEVLLGGVLDKHGLRDKVYIGTKMPLNMCRRREDFDKYFDEQLRRLKTDYVDYYFMHSIKDVAQWQNMIDLGIEDWIAEKKANGQIRQIGFSYHGTAKDFPIIVESYPWQFCMIQYNYYDEHYQAGRAGLELAAERGLTVMIMEPLLGGRLATGLPKKSRALMQESGIHPVDWALWWLWSHPEISIVVSGMNNVAQLEQNVQSCDNYRPLSHTERQVIAAVQEDFRSSYKIPCTSCNYCLPCPVGINIPSVLSAYNASFAQNRFTGIKLYAIGTALNSKKPLTPQLCNNCGKCEKICPQGIAIRREFRRVRRRLEPLPIKAGAAVLRKIMSR